MEDREWKMAQDAVARVLIHPPFSIRHPRISYSCSFSRILSCARFFAAMRPLMLPPSGCSPLGWTFLGGGGTGLLVAPPTTCVMSPLTPLGASNLALGSGRAAGAGAEAPAP